jgi:hypothetical protein
VVTVRVVKLDVDGPGPGSSSAADALAAPPVPPLVMVTWRDAFFDFDKVTADEFRTDYMVNTVGFLVSESPTFVSLAQEVLPDDEGYRAVTHIPKAVVQSIMTLGRDDASAQPAE